jgi:Domain of unknown function (DUF4296)
MMRKLSVVFLFLVCCACGPSKKPERVLTQPQLSELLIDIYMAEARLEMVHLPKDSTIRFFIPFEQKLLQAKGIPDSVLKSTYAYYLSHPKELEQVYDAVIDTLTVRDRRLSHGPVPKPDPKTLQ